MTERNNMSVVITPPFVSSGVMVNILIKLGVYKDGSGEGVLGVELLLLLLVRGGGELGVEVLLLNELEWVRFSGV